MLQQEEQEVPWASPVTGQVDLHCKCVVADGRTGASAWPQALDGLVPSFNCHVMFAVHNPTIIIASGDCRRDMSVCGT